MTFDWPLQPPFLTAKCRPAWVNRTTLLQLDFVQLLWHLFYLSHFSRLYKTALQSVSRVLGRVWRSPTLIGSHKDNFLSTFRYKKNGDESIFLGALWWAAGQKLCSEADQTEVKAAGPFAAARWQKNPSPNPHEHMVPLHLHALLSGPFFAPINPEI